MNEVLQAIREIDLTIYHFLSQFAGNYFLDRLASQAANNLLTGGVFLAAYWYLWFRPSLDRDKCRRAIIAVIVGSLLAIVVVRAVAIVVPFRIRPIYDPTVAHPSYSIPPVLDLENWSAFPSDTAAYFVALAFGLAYLIRPLAIPVLLYAVGWICLPRVYFGLHYASDISVGIAIGISMVWLSLRSKLLRSKVAPRVLLAIEASPQWFYAVAFLVSFEMATVFEGLRHVGHAVLTVVLAGLHIRYEHPLLNRAIDARGGLFAITGFMAIAAYVVFLLYRRFQDVRVVKRLHQIAPFHGPKRHRRWGREAVKF